MEKPVIEIYTEARGPVRERLTMFKQSDNSGTFYQFSREPVLILESIGEDELEGLRDKISKTIPVHENEGKYVTESGDVVEFFIYDYQFMCYWGEGYDEKVAKKSFDFITADNGFTNENISKLLDLHVGETANLSDPSGKLIITRVQ